MMLEVEVAPPAAAEEQWLGPVEILNEHGTSPIILICEHASNHIPAEYGRLGLDETELERHIALDIGAANVTRQLSGLLDAPAFLAGYSRLLIDLNRPLGTPGSVPVRAEATDIPGNRELSQAERARRAKMVFTPFHDSIVALLERRERAARPTQIVAIHSFTPVFLGKQRPWHVGVLFDGGRELAESIMSGLRSDPLLNVGANVPYIVSEEEDYALLVHGDRRGHPAVLVEIRNDLIATTEGGGDWARRLAAVLRDVISNRITGLDH